MATPKFFVLAGDGINCERETAWAVERAGGSAEIMHINMLLETPKKLLDYQAMILPGGFSFGDDLGSGQVLALKMKTRLNDAIREFVEKGSPVMGICNGFQALTKLGLLPVPFAERTMALAHNDSGVFINKWVRLDVNKDSPCIWTKAIEPAKIALPIRHGEGKVVFSDETVLAGVKANNQDVLCYREDVNGSAGNIAGICDEKGLIFGLMPHPEAAISVLQYPDSAAHDDRMAAGFGLAFFESAVQHLNS